MSNPIVLATQVLIQSGLTDRILLNGGEMGDGLWVLAFRPKTGTVPLGGLTMIRWRLVDLNKWGDLYSSEVLESEDRRSGANTADPEEVAHLNALLNATRAELLRKEKTPLTPEEYDTAARLLDATNAGIRAATINADRARVTAILRDAVETARTKGERAYYEETLARHLAANP